MGEVIELHPNPPVSAQEVLRMVSDADPQAVVVLGRGVDGGSFMISSVPGDEVLELLHNAQQTIAELAGGRLSD